MLSLEVAYQDHLKVVDVSTSTQHRTADRVFCLGEEPHGNVQAVLVARDWIQDQDLFPRCVDYEHEAMAASEGHEAVLGGDREGEAAFRDAIGGLHGRQEEAFAHLSDEAAEEGRIAAVVCAEAAGEAGVGG
jgi:hypothetical protein